MNLVKYFIFLL